MWLYRRRRGRKEEEGGVYNALRKSLPNQWGKKNKRPGKITG